MRSWAVPVFRQCVQLVVLAVAVLTTLVGFPSEVRAGGGRAFRAAYRFSVVVPVFQFDRDKGPWLVELWNVTRDGFPVDLIDSHEVDLVATRDPNQLKTSGAVRLEATFTSGDHYSLRLVSSEVSAAAPFQHYHFLSGVVTPKWSKWVSGWKAVNFKKITGSQRYLWTSQYEAPGAHDVPSSGGSSPTPPSSTGWTALGATYVGGWINAGDEAGGTVTGVNSGWDSNFGTAVVATSNGDWSKAITWTTTEEYQIDPFAQSARLRLRGRVEAGGAGQTHAAISVYNWVRHDWDVLVGGAENGGLVDSTVDLGLQHISPSWLVKVSATLFAKKAQGATAKYYESEIEYLSGDGSGDSGGSSGSGDSPSPSLSHSFSSLTQGNSAWGALSYVDATVDLNWSIANAVRTTEYVPGASGDYGNGQYGTADVSLLYRYDGEPSWRVGVIQNGSSDWTTANLKYYLEGATGSIPVVWFFHAWWDSEVHPNQVQVKFRADFRINGTSGVRRIESEVVTYTRP